MKIKVPAMEDIGFQMAPMIDIVFQLMIFFMCASHLHLTLDAPKVEIPLAAHASIPETLTPDRRVVTIQADGSVVAAGKVVTIDQLRQAIKDAQKQIPNLKIFLRADAKLKHKKVREVMQACADAGAADVIFAAFQTEASPQ